MLTIYKTIIDDLLNYAIEGTHEGGTAIGYNAGVQDSTAINNIKYKFIRKYDEVDSITDKNIIPILIITHPEQYLKGRVLYKQNFLDLKSILMKETDSTGVPIKKINFYVIPHIINIEGSSLGTITYDLKVDYVSGIDIYGFMSKEIDSILNRHYFKKHRGDWFNMNSPMGSGLFFVPKQKRFINQASLLNRIAQTYSIRFCSLV